jgi:carboxypeptidase C (cathepsin A)
MPLKATVLTFDAFGHALLVMLVSLMGGFPAAHASPGVNSTRSDVAAAADTMRFVTRHQIQLRGGTSLDYTTIAGETHIRNREGNVDAAIFSVAYVADSNNPEERPVTFIFNGGPGSSSVWLHLGAFGPRRVSVPSDGSVPGPPPYRLEDNPFTLLVASDLVFIDPVGTGYSRSLGDATDSEFWGVEGDAESVERFIRAWLTDNGRWGSPKYLAGESYGTVRATELFARLQGDFSSVALNGIILIAPAMDFTAFTTASGSWLPYVTFLPSFAATAFYHAALDHAPADREAFLAEAEQFAIEEYAPALIKGASIGATERDSLARRISHFTGLDESYIVAARLRVSSSRFLKAVLSDRGQILGRLDGRYVGEDEDALDDIVRTDVSSNAVDDVFGTLVHQYLREELDVAVDRPYEVLNLDANARWQRQRGTTSIFSGSLNNLPTLALHARRNPAVRIFVASGLYDLTTPYYSAEYMVNQSGIERDRIQLEVYDAGHMMYLHEESLERLSSDILRFLRTSPPTA